MKLKSHPPTPPHTHTVQYSYKWQFNQNNKQIFYNSTDLFSAQGISSLWSMLQAPIRMERFHFFVSHLTFSDTGVFTLTINIHTSINITCQSSLGHPWAFGIKVLCSTALYTASPFICMSRLQSQVVSLMILNAMEFIHRFVFSSIILSNLLSTWMFVLSPCWLYKLIVCEKFSWSVQP